MQKLLKPIIKTLVNPKILGLDKLTFTEPTILMPNHQSLLDPIILATILPPNVCFVVNTDIARKFAPVVNMRKHITIDPLNPFSIRKIIKEVKNGTPIMIFPEGRITTTGGLMKIYDGVAHIALKTNANIFPITLNGLEKSKLSYLQRKVKTHYFPKITITIGDPFKLQQVDTEKSLKLQKRQASDKILKVLQTGLVTSQLTPDVNLFNKLLDVTEEADVNRDLIEDITQKVSYKKLLLAIYALSTKLKGKERVGTLLPNSIAHVATLFALFKEGITPAILNFSQGAQTLLDCCETAGLKEILTSRTFIEKGKLQPLVDTLGTKLKITYLEDVKASISGVDKLSSLLSYKLRKRSESPSGKLILFTSGSENKPKGVVLSHRSIYTNILQAKSCIDVTDNDKFLNVLPMFHSFGLTAGTLLPLLSNVQLFLYPTPLHYKITSEIFYDKNCTVLFGTSTFLKGYGKNAHPYDFYSLRYAFAGAEKLKDEVRDLWFEKFGIKIFEGYGTTEAAPILSLNTPLLNRRGSVGCFLPGLDYKLEKVEGIENGGNLLVRGANLMEGYLIHSKGFVPLDNWYTTGDIVEVDEDGFIFIKARLKRFAKVAGEMVSLNLVEELASECFGTGNVATIAVADKNKGERIVLFTTDVKQELGLLKNFIRTRNLSPLLTPTQIVQITTIPLLGSGKTDYVTLQKSIK